MNKIQIQKCPKCKGEPAWIIEEKKGVSRIKVRCLDVKCFLGKKHIDIEDWMNPSYPKEKTNEQ